MKANETVLTNILEGTKQYIVPLFQRPYTWQKKHWETLWQDIMDLYEDDTRRTHFIGAMVTFPTVSVPEGVAKYLLIDGQQRLTTLAIRSSYIDWDHSKYFPAPLKTSTKMERVDAFPATDGPPGYR
ncbi:DUF262 domain-containing protein [Heliobacterium gestii]|uniref:DUF262 domain-containing protein n=1 Tax=Heliomicrobium gestii TaxID=2699 RepID=A0A845LLE6_HELGE|nr:DUF262 domain-containing protein [Heliomicrobium gestii]MBM7867401.1 uncharacterized protein with ParB-like and HNH nuclease domain [Heliomicrobium gestii]MZP43666.1 DUF262 domain-containing protein [Heliomicrobium gestii]